MPAIAQALQILAVLRDHPDGRRFTDLVTATGLPKSSVHSVLSQLCECRFVEAYDGYYRIGLGLVEVASARLNDTDLARAFGRVTASFDSLRDETVVLSILDKSEVVYLACRNGRRPIGVQYKIGMRLSAATTASGKAILATLKDDDVVELMKGSAGAAGGTGAVPSLEALLSELQDVRVSGYSLDDEETLPGLVCFGAAVREGYGKPVCHAVAVSVVKAAVHERNYGEFVSGIRKLAEALS